MVKYPLLLGWVKILYKKKIMKKPKNSGLSRIERPNNIPPQIQLRLLFFTSNKWNKSSNKDIDAVTSIPDRDHLKKKGFNTKENRAAYKILLSILFRDNTLYNRYTVVKVKKPLNILNEISGEKNIFEKIAPKKTHKGEVDPYVFVPVNENPLPVVRSFINPIWIKVSSPRNSG